MKVKNTKKWSTVLGKWWIMWMCSFLPGRECTAPLSGWKLRTECQFTPPSTKKSLQTNSIDNIIICPRLGGASTTRSRYSNFLFNALRVFRDEVVSIVVAHIVGFWFKCHLSVRTGIRHLTIFELNGFDGLKVGDNSVKIVWTEFCAVATL